MHQKFLILFIFLLFGQKSIAQLDPIPIGTWRSHFDYTKGKSLAKVGDKIYCAAENGLFVYDITENEATILNTDGGFYELNISQLAFHEVLKTLVIAYNSGAIDLVKFDTNYEVSDFTNLLSIKNSKTILDSKITNDIAFSTNIAFLSTDFGIVQIDLNKKEIKEIDLNLNIDGTKAKINCAVIIGDKIYSVNEKYLLEAKLNSNLQNFNEWEYTNLPIGFGNQSSKLIQNKGTLYCLVTNDGLYKFEGKKFQKLVNISEEAKAIVSNENNIQIGLKNRILNFEIATSKTIFTNDLALKNPQKIIVDGTKLWVADNVNGLLSNPSGSFQKFNPINSPGLITVRNDSIVKDQLGIIYTKLSRGNGLQISNNQGKMKSFSTIPLNPADNRFTSNTVNSIAVDKNNSIFVALNGGIIAINSDERLLEAQSLIGFITSPSINNVRVLANEIVLSIAVDGGNRKWVGTSTALYLFNEDLSEIISKFTNVNSPLPSNNINFLNIEPVSGELYVYTANGIVSYRTNATESVDFQVNNVLVFPNPVNPEFDGLVGISGLVNNAFVKITDIAGRLVYQTRANGGTATWDLNGQNNRRAESGIYYIFSGNEFGKETIVSKLAVIK
jgi:ligand-binding sensor domain-containing protein